MPTTSYLLLFSANLTFILTNLYGWLLKWFYKPHAYGDNFVQLFPAYKSVGGLCLLQVLELPYLLRIGEADALLYANAYSILVFPLLLLVMCERYFFPRYVAGGATTGCSCLLSSSSFRYCSKPSGSSACLNGIGRQPLLRWACCSCGTSCTISTWPCA